MVVVMEERATEAQIEHVVARLVEMGMDVHRSTGVRRTVLGAVGQGLPDPDMIRLLEGVREVVRSRSRTSSPAGPQAGQHGDRGRRGGSAATMIVMAGPCSAESESRSGRPRPPSARRARSSSAAARSSRAPRRTASRAWRGRAEAAARRRDAENLAARVRGDGRQPDRRGGRYGDVFQVGARNMQNFTLLRELGHARKPVMLKRGMTATIEEWLLAADTCWAAATPT